MFGRDGGTMKDLSNSLSMGQQQEKKKMTEEKSKCDYQKRKFRQWSRCSNRKGAKDVIPLRIAVNSSWK